MKTKKEKPNPITAKQMSDEMKKQDATAQEMMIAFAKQKVTEALEETSRHFKNPENVSYIKNHFDLDKIV